MKEKYLPIGTVCTVKNNLKKYMIVGYYSIEYLKNMKIYDYIAYPYPEGLLLSDKTLFFTSYN